jgi:hypothetical protein
VAKHVQLGFRTDQVTPSLYNILDYAFMDGAFGCRSLFICNNTIVFMTSISTSRAGPKAQIWDTQSSSESTSFPDLEGGGGKCNRHAVTSYAPVTASKIAQDVTFSLSLSPPRVPATLATLFDSSSLTWQEDFEAVTINYLPNHQDTKKERMNPRRRRTNCRKT